MYSKYKWYVSENTNSKKVSKAKFQDHISDICKVKVSQITKDDGLRVRVFVPKDVNTKSVNLKNICQLNESKN